MLFFTIKTLCPKGVYRETERERNTAPLQVKMIKTTKVFSFFFFWIQIRSAPSNHWNHFQHPGKTHHPSPPDDPERFSVQCDGSESSLVSASSQRLFMSPSLKNLQINFLHPKKTQPAHHLTGD